MGAVVICPYRAPQSSSSASKDHIHNLQTGGSLMVLLAVVEECDTEEARVSAEPISQQGESRLMWLYDQGSTKWAEWRRARNE